MRVSLGQIRLSVDGCLSRVPLECNLWFQHCLSQQSKGVRATSNVLSVRFEICHGFS